MKVLTNAHVTAALFSGPCYLDAGERVAQACAGHVASVQLASDALQFRLTASGANGYDSGLVAAQFSDVVCVEYHGVDNDGDAIAALSVFWCPAGAATSGGCCCGGSTAPRGFTAVTFYLTEGVYDSTPCASPTAAAAAAASGGDVGEVHDAPHAAVGHSHSHKHGHDHAHSHHEHGDAPVDSGSSASSGGGSTARLQRTAREWAAAVQCKRFGVPELLPSTLHDLPVGALHPSHVDDRACHGLAGRVAVTVDGGYGRGGRRRLLVFVNPVGGAGHALATFTNDVSPVLRHAQIDVELVGTCAIVWLVVVRLRGCAVVRLWFVVVVWWCGCVVARL